ncbi:TrbI/VirB10 family protein [Sphingomonas sp. ASV193]|uniref:TrbI/VirB10 family protein n=1 Tax=Sphingomonas sp. ASV193 TaxID=3144405 RepID=UPI0032E86CD9
MAGETIEPGSAGAVPKQDPETLVLRGRPRPVVRFRRGLIIALAGGSALAICGVTFIALKPAALHIVSTGDDDGRFGSTRTPEALANAPAGYGQIPKLGPPLPGDLGRPILDRQRELAGRAPPPAIDPGLDDAARRRSAANAERQRRVAQREAARTSALLVQLGRRTGEPATIPAPTPDVDPTSGEAASDAAGAKAAFAHAGDGAVNPARLVAPVSPYLLSAGTIIPASLVTGLDSDLPGMVVAQVTENVRDSATGRIVLVPQGARLIGRYDSAVAYGQRRALLIWQRIVLPDGSSIALDHLPATDAAGYSGLADRVNFHTLRLVEGIALASLLGIGTELVRQGDGSGLLGALRGSVQDNGSRAGDQLTKRNLDVQPTIRVRPGWPVRAIVNQDLVLMPWKER